jgi:hypothetical protein
MTPPATDLRRRQSALLLVGGWLLFFAPQIFSRGVPFRRDALLLHLPIRQFIHESLKAGALPQWYPYEGLGVPFIGQIITATFHPQTLLFLPFAPPLALKLNTLLAYLFGAVGAYHFARGFRASRRASLTGAAALTFGGYALSMSDNLPYLMGLMTLPWVGWATQRVVRSQRGKDVALLGLSWALIFLAGDAQSFALAPLLMLAVALGERAPLKPYLLLAASGVLAVLLISAELLPAMAVYSESARFAGQSVIDFGRFWALHPLRVLELITPQFLPAESRMEIGQALFGQPFVWSMSIFAGGLVLLLAAAGASKRSRISWAMLAFTLLALWLALGTRGGLHYVLTKLLPPFGMFRFPEKFLALFWVGLVPLVALGWDVVSAEPRRWMKIALGASVAVLLLMLAVPLLEQPAGMALPWRTGLFTTAILLAATALLLHLPRALPWIPLLLVAELWHGNTRHFSLVTPNVLQADRFYTAVFVREDSSRGLAPPRIVNTASPKPVKADTEWAFETWTRDSISLLRPNVAGLAHVSVMGHSALPAFGGRARLLYGPNGARDEQFSSILGACYKTAGIHPPIVGALPRALTHNLVDISHQPCRPRAYLSEMTSVENADAAFSVVGAGLADQHAVWEHGPVSTSHAGTVEWLEWSPGRIRLLTDAPAPAALVINESFAPGWHADIGGAKTEILPTNVVAMGLPIAPGKHTVTLSYRAPNLTAGLVLSGLGLLLCGVLILRQRSSTAR